MDTAKAVKKYGKVFRKILVMGSYPDPDVKQDSYETRLTKMYASEKYTEHNKDADVIDHSLSDPTKEVKAHEKERYMGLCAEMGLNE